MTVLAACDCETRRHRPDQSDRVSITTGAWGDVWLFGTEPVPRADGCSTPQKVLPAAFRTVLFFEFADSGDVVRAAEPGEEGGVYFEELLTPVVDSVATDELGFYQITLPPGEYSALLRTGSLLHWPEGVRGDATINRVVVPVGGVVEERFTVSAPL